MTSILEKYPFLHSENGEVISLEIPKGWYKLFFQMCDDIKPLVEKIGSFYFIQVKEKYNQLRCYHNGDTLEIDNIIHKYEMMARNVCCVCGRPAEYETRHYIASYCNDCWKDYTRHEAGNFFKPQTSFVVTQFGKEGHKEIEISFKEEWERYLKENNL